MTRSKSLTKMMKRVRTVAVAAVLLCSPAIATADVVTDWNAIAVATSGGQNPFNQARLMAITQLAVFEAVNAVTGKYEPYLGDVVVPAGASASAAAVAAAHGVLKYYFPASAVALDAARASSLAAIPDGSSKDGGVATGEAAAAAMIVARLNDGSAVPEFHVPASSDPGVWQLTPSCPAAGGVFLHWRNVTPFGIARASDFLADPPPALTSNEYAKDYNEVKRVGSLASTERPQDRTDVARFYAASSPAYVMNLAARQVAIEQGRSIEHNARAFAVINMAISDSLVASFGTKYHYNFWRPETAIRAGDLDGNDKTDPDITWTPLILTPCFPSYVSNHASGSYGGAEALRRIYGAGGHAITIANPAVPGIVLHYTKFDQITADIDDARVYGGIHFRFDQEGGARLGRDVGTYVYLHNLRRVSPASGTATTISAFGSGTNENQFLIEGTNMTCPCNGVARSEPGGDFIQEIQVQSVGASAEFGNVQGAVVNVITKQGSDRLDRHVAPEPCIARA